MRTPAKFPGVTTRPFASAYKVALDTWEIDITNPNDQSTEALHVRIMTFRGRWRPPIREASLGCTTNNALASASKTTGSILTEVGGFFKSRQRETPQVRLRQWM